MSMNEWTFGWKVLNGQRQSFVMGSALGGGLFYPKHCAVYPHLDAGPLGVFNTYEDAQFFVHDQWAFSRPGAPFNNNYMIVKCAYYPSIHDHFWYQTLQGNVYESHPLPKYKSSFADIVICLE